MFVSFLSNDKAVMAPVASVHFTFVGAEGFTAYVGGVKFHPVDPRSLALHEPGEFAKTMFEMAEKSRVSGFTPA